MRSFVPVGVTYIVEFERTELDRLEVNADSPDEAIERVRKKCELAGTKFLLVREVRCVAVNVVK